LIDYSIMNEAKTAMAPTSAVEDASLPDPLEYAPPVDMEAAALADVLTALLGTPVGEVDALAVDEEVPREARTWVMSLGITMPFPVVSTAPWPASSIPGFAANSNWVYMTFMAVWLHSLSGILARFMPMPHMATEELDVWFATYPARAAMEESFWDIIPTYDMTLMLLAMLMELLELLFVDEAETAAVETSALGGLMIPNMPFWQ